MGRICETAKYNKLVIFVLFGWTKKRWRCLFSILKIDYDALLQERDALQIQLQTITHLFKQQQAQLQNLQQQLEHQQQ